MPRAVRHTTLSWVTGTQAACDTARVGTCQTPFQATLPGTTSASVVTGWGAGHYTKGPATKGHVMLGGSAAQPRSPGLPSTPSSNLEPGSRPASTILAEPLNGPAVHAAPSV